MVYWIDDHWKDGHWPDGHWTDDHYRDGHWTNVLAPQHHVFDIRQRERGCVRLCMREGVYGVSCGVENAEMFSPQTKLGHKPALN